MSGTPTLPAQQAAMVAAFNSLTGMRWQGDAVYQEALWAKAWTAALASGATQPSEPITASIMRDDGGDRPAFCLMAAFRTEGEARAALAALATPPTGEPKPAPVAEKPRQIVGRVLYADEPITEQSYTPIYAKKGAASGEPLTAPNESVIRNTFESSMHEGFTRREDGGEGRYTMMTVEDEWHSFERGYRAALAATAAPTESEPAKWIDDPHDIEQGQIVNPAWIAAGRTTPPSPRGQGE